MNMLSDESISVGIGAVVERLLFPSNLYGNKLLFLVFGKYSLVYSSLVNFMVLTLRMFGFSIIFFEIWQDSNN